MKAIFYDQNTMADAWNNIQPASLSTGQFYGLVCVNGRPCMGTGHTRLEAALHTIQAAKIKFRHNDYIFDLIGRKPLVMA